MISFRPLKGRSVSWQVATKETLEASGFIRSYRSYGTKKKNMIYQLTDPFSLFHFRFLETPSSDEHFWSATQTSPAQAAWRGLAFERLCLLHLPQIRNALGIGSVHVEAYGWSFKGNETYPNGAQIDLVLDRADNIVNITANGLLRNPYANRVQSEIALSDLFA